MKDLEKDGQMCVYKDVWKAERLEKVGCMNGWKMKYSEGVHWTIKLIVHAIIVIEVKTYTYVGWIDEWMNGWMDGWMDGWKIQV